MAINLMLDNDNENIPIQVEDGNPYYVGARAYVEQLPTGAKITVIDKEGTTTAIVDDGAAAGFGTVSATVDSNVGTPSVTVTASGSDTAKNFAFDFKNLKGEKGDTGNTGAAAGFGTVTATIDDNVGTPSVTVTTSGDDTAKNFDFAFENMKGDKGDKGDTGDINMAQLQAVLVKETASGSIASIDDGADSIPVIDLTADIEPIQDLNGYDKPWVGGAGKNKLDIDSVTTSASANWGVSVSGNTLTVEHKNTYSTGLPRTADMALTAGTYCISYTASTNIVVDVYVNGSWFKAVNTGGTFTLSADSTVYIAFPNTQATTITYQDVQLESGSTPTTYAPYSNICPISGHTDVVVSRTGVNVWDEEWELGGFNADGSKSAVADRIRSKNYIPCVGNTSYYIKQGTLSDTAWSYFVFYDANKSVIGSRVTVYGTFTTPSNAQYMKFNTNNSYGTTYNNDISINYPSTDTSYHAYEGDTYTTALGTTVYGGTLDVTTGVLTVTHAIEDLGNLNWVYSTGQNNYFYSSTIADFKFIDNDTVNYICSAYESYSVNERYKNGYVFINSGKQAIIVDNNYTSAAAFKTAVTGQKIVYELATPTTTTLTAQQIDTLLGANNIWASSGDVEVRYCADTALYVAKVTA